MKPARVGGGVRHVGRQVRRRRPAAGGSARAVLVVVPTATADAAQRLPDARRRGSRPSPSGSRCRGRPARSSTSRVTVTLVGRLLEHLLRADHQRAVLRVGAEPKARNGFEASIGTVVVRERDGLQALDRDRQRDLAQLDLLQGGVVPAASSWCCSVTSSTGMPCREPVPVGGRVVRRDRRVVAVELDLQAEVRRRRRRATPTCFSIQPFVGGEPAPQVDVAACSGRLPGRLRCLARSSRAAGRRRCAACPRPSRGGGRRSRSRPRRGAWRSTSARRPRRPSRRRVPTTRRRSPVGRGEDPVVGRAGAARSSGWR